MNMMPMGATNRMLYRRKSPPPWRRRRQKKERINCDLVEFKQLQPTEYNWRDQEIKELIYRVPEGEQDNKGDGVHEGVHRHALPEDLGRGHQPLARDIRGGRQYFNPNNHNDRR